jgi:hypothetical protein
MTVQETIIMTDITVISLHHLELTTVRLLMRNGLWVS